MLIVNFVLVRVEKHFFSLFDWERIVNFEPQTISAGFMVRFEVKDKSSCGNVTVSL